MIILTFCYEHYWHIFTLVILINLIELKLFGVTGTNWLLRAAGRPYNPQDRLE